MPVRRATIATGGVLALALSIAIPNIQKFEGLRHRTYPDVGQVLSICNGHTGPDVKVNTYYTTAQCYALTQVDATKAANGVLKYSPSLIKYPTILAAAISFSYNVGVGTYDKSSVARDFNLGDYAKGCSDLLKYVNIAGKYSNGLYNRRKAEYTICMKGLKDVPTTGTPTGTR